MCGINGFNFKDDDLIKKMMFFTKNRGPDFSDYISNQNITLGHDRLSILDLKYLYIFFNAVLAMM
jgi:asparagine synthase (glutamine-hydrolysing)